MKEVRDGRRSFRNACMEAYTESGEAINPHPTPPHPAPSPASAAAGRGAPGPPPSPPRSRIQTRSRPQRRPRPAASPPRPLPGAAGSSHRRTGSWGCSRWPRWAAPWACCSEAAVPWAPAARRPPAAGPGRAAPSPGRRLRPPTRAAPPAPPSWSPSFLRGGTAPPLRDRLFRSRHGRPRLGVPAGNEGCGAPRVAATPEGLGCQPCPGSLSRTGAKGVVPGSCRWCPQTRRGARAVG